MGNLISNVSLVDKFKTNADKFVDITMYSPLLVALGSLYLVPERTPTTCDTSKIERPAGEDKGCVLRTSVIGAKGKVNEVTNPCAGGYV